MNCAGFRRNASTFGNQDNCTPLVKYVIFVPLPALHSGRIVGLTVTSILTVAYVFITAHELLSYFKKKKGTKYAHKSDIEIPRIHVEDTSGSSTSDLQKASITFPLPSLASTRSGSVLQEDALAMSKTGHRARKPKRQRRQEWSPDLDPMLLGITIFQVIVFVYFVTMTELLLGHNPAVDSSQDSEWGFGQACGFF